MTRLQKLLALLISLSIAIMIIFYGRYILKSHEPNTFLSRQYPEPIEKDGRSNDIIHEQLKHNSHTSDVIHDSEKHVGHTSDVIHEQLEKDGRTNDVLHKLMKHSGPTNYVIHKPTLDSNRRTDTMHKLVKNTEITLEPETHDHITNIVKHEPVKQDETNDVIFDPVKQNGRTRIAIHEPLKHGGRTNVNHHEPLKQKGRPYDVIHERPVEAINKPLKHSGITNKDRQPSGYVSDGNARVDILPYKSGNVTDHTHAQITFRKSSLDESVQSLTSSVVPVAPPTMPAVCTYSGHNVIKVNTSGNFLQRLQMYNDAIGRLRQQILAARPLVSPWKPIAANLAVLWGNRDDFLQCLSLRDEVITMTLPWRSSGRNRKWTSRRDRRNVLVQNYYEWTATEPLCSWIGQRGFTKARWDAVYNRTCVTNTSRSVVPTSLEPVYLHGKPINVRDYWPNSGDAYPAHFYTHPPEHVFYMHLARDAVITDLGDIISGSLKFLPYSCSQDTTATPPRGYAKTVVYGEVFIMTQFWGGAHFHKMLEGFPRLAPYLAFLRANEHVLIHAAETSGYTAATLHFLGLNPERLVTGLCRAKVVYMPQSTPCGFAHAQSTQLLSALYRERIRRKATTTRNGLVLVQRSGTRRFTRAGAIQAALRSVANETGLVFELYPDQPPPSMDVSMRTFAGAAVVVAPHGAGLSNLVYAQPGTYVVEAVCNPPHVNMCYQWTAHVLGMRYHALPSRHGCEAVIDVDVDVITDVVRMYARRAAAELRVRMRGNG